MFVWFFMGIVLFIVTVILVGVVAGPKWPGYVALLVIAIINAGVATLGLAILGIDQASHTVQSTRNQIMFGTDALCLAGSALLGYHGRWGLAVLTMLAAVPAGLGLLIAIWPTR